MKCQWASHALLEHVLRQPPARVYARPRQGRRRSYSRPYYYFVGLIDGCYLPVTVALGVRPLFQRHECLRVLIQLSTRQFPYFCRLGSASPSLLDKTNSTCAPYSRMVISKVISETIPCHGSECAHTHLSLISVSTTWEACTVCKAYWTGCGDAATRQRWTCRSVIC